MSDSDDDDIIWEDDDGAGVENAVNVLAEEDLEIDMSEGGDVDDTLDKGKDVGKKGKDKKKYFPAEMWCHIEAAERFRGGLKRILKSVKNDSLVCNDELISATITSLLPSSLAMQTSKFNPNGHSYSSYAAWVLIHQILVWFQSVFAIANGNDFYIVDNVSKEHLQEIILSAGSIDYNSSSSSNNDNSNSSSSRKRKGIDNPNQIKVTPRQMCLLSIALFRGLGLPCRFVRAFEPPSFKWNKHADLFEGYWRRSQKRDHPDIDACQFDSTEVMDKWHKRHPDRKGGKDLYWIELYVNGSPSATTSNSKASPSKGKGNKDDPVMLVSSDDEDYANEKVSASATTTASNVNSSFSSNKEHSSSYSSSQLTSDTMSADLTDQSDRWIHIDVVNGKVDRADEALGKSRTKNGANRMLQYVVAMDELGIPTDVYSRYNRGETVPMTRYLMQFQNMYKGLLMQMEAHVTNSNFLTQNFEGVNTHTSNEIIQKLQQNLKRQRDEQNEFTKNKMVHGKAKPKTLKSFKNHPVYILERDFHQDQGVPPGCKSQGLIQGHKYYLKADVQPLRKLKKWAMSMRQVKEAEYDTPAKIVTRKATKTKPEYHIYLYGQWQTEELIINPIGADGVLPTNEHGNYEMWDYNKGLVPQGATFIDGREVDVVAHRKAAREMNFSFVDCIVGFDYSGGHPHPKIGGILVLSQDYHMIAEGASNVVVDKAEKAEKKKTQQVLAKWDKLVRTALLRERLKREYLSNEKISSSSSSGKA